MNEFLYNIMYRASDEVKKLEVNNEFNNKNCVVVGDEHDIAYHICGAYCMLNDSTTDVDVHLVIDQVPANEILMKNFLESFNSIHVWHSLEEYINAKNDRNGEAWKDKDELFIDIVNLRLSVFSQPGEARDRAYLQREYELSTLLNYNKNKPANKIQLITCIPSIDEPLPDVVHAVAEREYEVVYRDKPVDSPEKFVIYLEQMIRDFKGMAEKVQVIRLDRVFGPGIYSDDGTFINSIFEDFRDEKPLAIRDCDRYDFLSVSFVSDAVLTVMLAIATGRMGNIYNVSSWEISRYQIISLIFDLFPEKNVVIDTEHDDCKHNVTYRMLNSKKSELINYQNLSKRIRSEKSLAITDTGYWFLNEKNYIPQSDTNVYYGRMNRIREIELEILKEVDKICKDNNIPYFLAAGTMLGAVRHKGFIPWDDDVDIGMLPEDYERFIQVCPNHLSIEYGYQGAMFEEDCHYIHDKIRLKNSFFSTKYSDRYNMLNGVYIDVFVYYKTSNKPRAQKRHINQVRIARNLLGIRWADKKYQKGKIYSFCYDVSHMFSGSVFDKLYRRICMKYNNKDTSFRIDGGFNLEKAGAVPDAWFHGTVDAEFCGCTFPILEHYNDFLTHWYSSHYMELLPIDGRVSVHDVVRIDIGQYLFDETKNDTQFRNVDLRGELYEVNK